MIMIIAVIFSLVITVVCSMVLIIMVIYYRHFQLILEGEKLAIQREFTIYTHLTHVSFGCSQLNLSELLQNKIGINSLFSSYKIKFERAKTCIKLKLVKSVARKY